MNETGRLLDGSSMASDAAESRDIDQLVQSARDAAILAALEAQFVFFTELVEF